MTNESKATYRLREYNRSGSVSYTYSNDYDELSNRLDDGIDAGCLTGGDIDEYVYGFGYVVMENHYFEDNCAVSDDSPF